MTRIYVIGTDAMSKNRYAFCYSVGSSGSSCTNGPQPLIGFFMLEGVAAGPPR
jgi:hypothetical protein